MCSYLMFAPDLKIFGIFICFFAFQKTKFHVPIVAAIRIRNGRQTDGQQVLMLTPRRAGLMIALNNLHLSPVHTGDYI